MANAKNWKLLYTIQSDNIGETLSDAKQRRLKHYKNVCKKHGGTIFLVCDNSCPHCVKEAKKLRRDNDIPTHRTRELIGEIKNRALKRGLEVTITSEFIRNGMQVTCPVLGIPIMYQVNAYVNSPSVDRLDSSLGYTPDNCKVISNRANIIKSDGTIEEHLRIALWMAQEYKMNASDLHEMINKLTSDYKYV